MNLSANSNTMNASSYGMSIHRIRSPHAHDVLSGRGGGINGHVGNLQFREWVAVRKNDYNLAPSKVDKARVTQEVIAMVRSQDPPGRFLQKDPSAGVGNWWVEVDADRVIAKTSQALREGAPRIRAAHKEVINQIKSPNVLRRPTTSRNNRKAAVVPNKAVFSGISAPLKKRGFAKVAYQQKAMEELRSNVEEARWRNDLLENDPIIREQKRVKVDMSDMALAVPPPMPSSVVPRQSFAQEQRQNSLALSELSFDPDMEDFVDPFADEEPFATDPFMADPRHSVVSVTSSEDTWPSAPTPGIFHETSSTSQGGMGGFRSLSVPRQGFGSRSTSITSQATEVTKLDWDDSDPLLAYLTSLDRGVDLPRGLTTA
jgi:hypothetical protein